MLTRQRTGKSSHVLMQSLLHRRQLEDTREKVAYTTFRKLRFCGNSFASGSAVQGQDQWEGVET